MSRIVQNKKLGITVWFGSLWIWKAFLPGANFLFIYYYYRSYSIFRRTYKYINCFLFFFIRYLCKGPASLHECKHCRGLGSFRRSSYYEKSVMTSRPERCAVFRISAAGICRNTSLFLPSPPFSLSFSFYPWTFCVCSRLIAPALRCVTRRTFLSRGVCWPPSAQGPGYSALEQT